MGEERWRIRTVGEPGLDHLVRTPLPDAAAVLDSLGLPAHDERPLFLVTYHPTTIRRGASESTAMIHLETSVFRY